jgi:hypothetical protein
MKPYINAPVSAKSIPLCALLGIACLNSTLLAGEGAANKGPELTSRGSETEMDLPSSYHKFFGQNVTYYKDAERKVARIDVDADLNYDGSISNEDPADNGAFEVTPPGLVLGVGEMSKVIMRLRPYRVDFLGDVVVGIEIGGINRAAKTGRFESFEEEKAAVGRVRVWKDKNKTELLLDSGDPSKLSYEFTMDAANYPANLPDAVPRALYIEGVGVSGQYAGDVRLLTTVSYRDKETEAKVPASERKHLPQTFRTAYDHMIFTVKSQPMKKSFVNDNAEGVWVTR